MPRCFVPHSLLVALLSGVNPVALPAEEKLPARAVCRLGRVKNTDAAQGHTARVSAVAITQDAKVIATGGWDNTVRLWDAASGKQLHCLQGHSDAVFFVAFAPDDKTLASSSRDGSVRLWDVAGARELRQWAAHENGTFGLAFGLEGKTLASGGSDGAVRIWSPQSGKLLQCLEDAKSAVTSVVFSPDGKILAAGCKSGAIVIWDAVSGKELRRLSGHQGWVYPLVMSPDGKMLISGGRDGMIRLWEVASGKVRRQLPRQEGDVFTLAIAPDGRTLASACAEAKVIRLWETASGRLRSKLEGHQEEVYRVAFSPDGSRLVSASHDHTAIVWDVTPAVPDVKARPVLEPADVEKCWTALTKSDAEAAYDIIVRLAVAAPEPTLAVLEKQLKTPRPRAARAIVRLVAQLDDDDFDVREKASADLARIGMPALSELRRMLRTTTSAEARRRADDLLARLDADDWLPAEELRAVRAVEVLERMHTPAASKLLEDLARSAPEPDLRECARDALQRLKRK